MGVTTRRPQLLSKQQGDLKDNWAVTRLSYDDREEDIEGEQSASKTKILPRYKVVLACTMAFVVCNMVRSSTHS